MSDSMSIGSSSSAQPVSAPSAPAPAAAPPAPAAASPAAPSPADQASIGPAETSTPGGDQAAQSIVSGLGDSSPSSDNNSRTSQDVAAQGASAVQQLAHQVTVDPAGKGRNDSVWHALQNAGYSNREIAKQHLVKQVQQMNHLKNANVVRDGQRLLIPTKPGSGGPQPSPSTQSGGAPSPAPTRQTQPTPSPAQQTQPSPAPTQQTQPTPLPQPRPPQPAPAPPAPAPSGSGQSFNDLRDQGQRTSLGHLKGLQDARQLSNGGLYYKAAGNIDTDGSGSHHGDRTSQNQTTLRDNHGRSLNADQVPYFVLPPQVAHSIGAKPGDLGMIKYGDKVIPAVFGDTGPRSKIGEMSTRAAQMLGINSNPNSGGVGGGVEYMVFPGSGTSRPDASQLSPAALASRLGMQ